MTTMYENRGNFKHRSDTVIHNGVAFTTRPRERGNSTCSNSLRGILRMSINSALPIVSARVSAATEQFALSATTVTSSARTRA